MLACWMRHTVTESKWPGRLPSRWKKRNRENARGNRVGGLDVRVGRAGYGWSQMKSKDLKKKKEREKWHMSVKRRNISGCSFCALYENNSVLPKHVHNNIVLLAVFSAHESTHWTTREHNTYCYWIPIMMHNPVAAQEYNTNMSGLWFGRNLHGYNSLSTGSRLSRARRLHCNDWPCAFDSLFQASVAQSAGSLSHQYPILILLSTSLHKHVWPLTLPATSPPPFQSSLSQWFFFCKWLLYHRSISH